MSTATPPRPLPLDLDLGLDELDLDELVAAGLVEEEATLDGLPPGLDADPELTRLSRRISGQYVEVIATWAHSAFRGHARGPHLAPVLAALPALHRLAEATQDRRMAEVIAELEDLAGGPHGPAHPHQRLVPRLRDWLRRFADLLEGPDAQRLRDLVEFDRKAFPLLEQLARVRGVGPRRLERLYLSGLFTVESLYGADPAEVALVTGFPRELAAEVVDAAARFERQWREQVAADLVHRAAEVRAVLRWIETSGRQDPQVLAAVTATIDELESALHAAVHHSQEGT
ncbi:helix-hairpin-helix domain-containing protein [Myxococcota bacterium]|nr:helix-hairpin-helix domain-containing protein [Myxococcota bacterium]